MRDKQVALVRHAIGLDGRSKTTYRNHYCVGSGNEDHTLWNDLVDKGLATVRRNIDSFGGMDMFYATREAAVMALRKGEKLAEDFR